MSTDEDYASFLDKANQDTSGGSSTQKKGGDTQFKATKATDTDVPVQLKSLGDDEFYTSDTDEPFEGVALKYGGGGDLDEGSFGDLIKHSGKVEAVNASEWNVKGRYEKVLEAVEEAAGVGREDVKAFRVEHGSTRCEYYVVAVGKGKEAKGKVVGVKAKAVES